MAILEVFVTGWGESKDNQGQRNNKVVRMVSTDESGTTPTDIYNSVGVFAGDLYPYDTSGTCASNFDVERDTSNPCLWTYTITYSTQSSSSTNPLDEPYEIEFEDETYDKEIEKDANGNSILNPAGRPYIKRSTIQKSIEVIRIRKNRATDDSVLANYVANKLNESTWNGRAAKTCKTCYPRRRSAWAVINGARRMYWQTELVVKCKEDGWKDEKLNQGFEYKDGDGKLVEALDKNLQPVKQPIMLKSDGTKLEDGGTPTFSSFDTIPTIDFSIFGLDGLF